MKAVICTKYGPPEVLQFAEVQKPTPKDKEVLIKIYATTVHIGDTKIRRLEPGYGPVTDFFFKPIMRLIMGFRGPRKPILGMELAGVIETVGKNVKLFKKGDKVYAATGMSFGAYAEYKCMPENATLLKMPTNMSFAESTTVINGGITALSHLRKANIKNGQKVLIYGASGSVGTFAIQIAKYYGAEVTGVCSTANLELVKSLGADKAIDYTQEDFTKNNEMYDFIFDAVGKIPSSNRKTSLNKDGNYSNVLSLSGGLATKVEDVIVLQELIEAGHLKTVIDSEYPLDQIVEAHRYVDKGHKKGNVVINVI